MKRKGLLKRNLAVLLTAVMTLGIVSLGPNDVTKVRAEETKSKSTIMLGTSGIGNPSSSGGGWSYVYFGTYNNSPVKYRVLAKETTDFGKTTMLLDCDSILENAEYDGVKNALLVVDVSGADEKNSEIGTYLNDTFLSSSFSSIEQKAIAESHKDTYSNSDGAVEVLLKWEPLTGEKIFLLDGREVNNASYGYSSNNSRKKEDGKVAWWLRSHGSRSESNYGYGIVALSGSIDDDTTFYDAVGVSPALNINLSSVLFSSKADDTSKSSVLSANSSEVAETQVTEWKLTLKDSGKSVSITDGNSVTRKSDGTITVPYTYADNSTTAAETVNQISIMITDQAYNADGAKILYYGKLDTTLSTGTGTFTLPEALKDQTFRTDYYIYILAEHVSGEKVTDYASAPLEITSIVDVSDAPTTNTTDDSNNNDTSTSTETTVEAAPITITYTVKKDDYMRKIAREHGITLEQLIALNPQIKNPNLIYAGQVLIVGQTGSIAVTTETTATKTYTVQRGDSLYKIARKNGMTLAELKSLNENLFAQKYIFAGQTVLLK